MRPLFTLLAAAALLPLAAFSSEERVGRDAERGDPARWFQPADTPQEKYRTAMKEASAARAEALEECRASSERRACEAEARRHYQADVERARAFLARPKLG